VVRGWRGIVVVAGVTAMVGTGCGGADPLDTTCADYLGLGGAERYEVTAVWASPNRQEPDPAQASDIPFYLDQLTRYCSTDPGRTLGGIAFDPAVGPVGVGR
jgi:hypothetical protein